MKSNLLIPNRWKLPALGVFACSLVLFVLVDQANLNLPWLNYESGNWSNDNLTDELAMSGVILSLLALCCCRERVEDEYVRSIRLASWVVAIFVNYALIMLMIWTKFGLAFLGVLFYNILTPVLIYLLVFYMRMHILPRFGSNDAPA